MSLSPLAWRYVGAQAFASATVAAVLDALYTLGTAVTYADATTRTPGSGSAWTWSRYQNASVTEACYATPPTVTLGLRVILAGAASLPSPSPTMATPDAAAINVLNVNVIKNAGSFASWNAASPFTSGQTFGYWRVWATAAGAGTVRLYEGTEAVVVLIETASAATYGAILGAILDSESTDVVNDSESDGKLYGIITSGTSANISGTIHTVSQFLDHSTTASQHHAGIFTPGGSTLLPMNRRIQANVAMTTTGLRTRAGRFVRAPYDYRATASAPNDVALGRLREISMFSDGKTGTKLTSGGTTIGYLVGGSSSTDVDVVILAHA
jgi:hypothetical protein